MIKNAFKKDNILYSIAGIFSLLEALYLLIEHLINAFIPFYSINSSLLSIFNVDGNLILSVILYTALAVVLFKKQNCGTVTNISVCLTVLSAVTLSNGIWNSLYFLSNYVLKKYEPWYNKVLNLLEESNAILTAVVFFITLLLIAVTSSLINKGIKVKLASTLSIIAIPSAVVWFILSRLGNLYSIIYAIICVNNKFYAYYYYSPFENLAQTIFNVASSTISGIFLVALVCLLALAFLKSAKKLNADEQTEDEIIEIID